MTIFILARDNLDFEGALFHNGLEDVDVEPVEFPSQLTNLELADHRFIITEEFWKRDDIEEWRKSWQFRILHNYLSLGGAS